MKKIVVGLLGVSLLAAGCSGPNTTARNVQTGATMTSLAGVPGSGVVGLAAMGVDLISRVGRPEIGKLSSGLNKHIIASPTYIMKPDRSVVWQPHKRPDGGISTKENAPQISMDYTQTFSKAMGRFFDGDFGDGSDAEIRKNLDAWENKGQVVAKYNGPNGIGVVFVSNSREKAEVMTETEWAARQK